MGLAVGSAGGRRLASRVAGGAPAAVAAGGCWGLAVGEEGAWQGRPPPRQYRPLHRRGAAAPGSAQHVGKRQQRQPKVEGGDTSE